MYMPQGRIWTDPRMYTRSVHLHVASYNITIFRTLFAFSIDAHENYYSNAGFLFIFPIYFIHIGAL